LQQH